MSDDRSPTAPGDRKPLVRVRGLKKHFYGRRPFPGTSRKVIRAVDGFDLDIFPGETLGLVGESGCGKSTVARTILYLLKPTEGQIEFLGQDLSRLSQEQFRRLRRQMQIVFQDPYASLDPRMTVASILREPLRIHRIGSSREQNQRVAELLTMVGLNPEFSRRYPHEFSGGQRQRIGIARALAAKPSFIVADEPISALDVSIQAQVVNLLQDLKEELGLTYLFIAHDLSMVRHISDRVAVMYLGRMVELGSRNQVFQSPRHPYTQALLAALPVPDPSVRPDPSVMRPAELPDPSNLPEGCRFHPRCPYATEICLSSEPELRTDPSQHAVACHYAEEIKDET